MLGILGVSAFISSCEGITPSTADTTRCMYGVPYINYSIKGKVVDSETGLGVAGIEVARMESQIDTTGTDGYFELSGESFSFSADEVELSLRDIDPTKDGNYKSDTVLVRLTEVVNGEGWFQGQCEAKDLVLKVEKQ